MSEISLEELLPRSGNSIYKLVGMASKRALELSDGKKSLLENPTSEKLTTIALEEIAAGMIETKEVADKRVKEEKAVKKTKENQKEEISV